MWYSHLFKNFSQCVEIHIVKGFSIVNEIEVDVFLEFPCFFHDPVDVGSLISGSSAFSKPSLYIWKFSVHILLKLSLKDFEHYLASMWNELSLGLEWKLTFSSPVVTAEFSKFAGILSASSFQICNSSAGIPSPPVALFIVMLPKAHLTSHSRRSSTQDGE